jgi:hypothetical protein
MLEELEYRVCARPNSRSEGFTAVKREFEEVTDPV